LEKTSQTYESRQSVKKIKDSRGQVKIIEKEVSNLSDPEPFFTSP
jgi:hypothetical protein